MKYLIVGLGNIGSEYENTRHNIGFRVLDALAKASNLIFTDGRYGATCELRVKGRTLVLLKPSTYMNLSGNAVRYWLQKENIPVENLLVVVDDLALPFGTLRLKPKGSDAGHNGLKHICETLGTQAYARLRFGIGKIDKFMWATRIFKTRTIATEACKKGRVMVGGVTIKPSRTVKVGDVIQVRKPPVTYSFKILALAENRMGAKLVPGYLDNITPPEQYELLDMVRISGFVNRQKGLGRPTKRDGRQMAQFLESQYADDGFDFDFDFDDDFDDEQS